MFARRVQVLLFAILAGVVSLPLRAQTAPTLALDIKHGGLQTVAAHLVHDLKKAMQSK